MIKQQEIKELHQISSLKGIWAMLVEWVLLLSAIILLVKVDNIYVTLLGLIFIAARQHALAFMVHEGVHYLVSKNKFLNDFMVNVLAAWPMFFHLQTYRVNHLAHHRHTNSSKDPDLVRKTGEEWVFPIKPLSLFGYFIKSFLGLYSLKTFNALAGKDAIEKKVIPRKKISIGWMAFRVSYYLMFIILFTYFKLWPIFLLYWVLPILTWLQVLNRLRKIAEHFGIYDKNGEAKTRTVITSWWEDILISPKNINFHTEHHVYPQIPHYYLPVAHNLMMKDETKRNQGHVTFGYFNVLQECIRSNKA